MESGSSRCADAARAAGSGGHGPVTAQAVLITGGIPSLTRPTDDVYRATYPRVIEKNRRYFERYPGDRERVRQQSAQALLELVGHLVERPTELCELVASLHRDALVQLSLSEPVRGLDQAAERPHDRAAFDVREQRDQHERDQ